MCAPRRKAIKTVNIELARRLITGIIGLGVIGFGLLLVVGALLVGCEDAETIVCAVFVVILLVLGAVYSLLGTPIVLAAFRPPGTVHPMVVVACMTLTIGGAAILLDLGYRMGFLLDLGYGVGSGYVNGALVSFAVIGSFFFGYLVAPRKASE